MNIDRSPTTRKEGSIAPELRFAHLAPHVWQKLDEIERTGWVRRGVQRPETVQQHTLRLREIAVALKGLSVEEQDELTDMLEVHDWPEAIHGDEVIVTNDGIEKKRLKAIKFENEKRALESICEELGDAGSNIMRLWLRFEAAADEAATLANQIDKYQAIEKALQYELEQGLLIFREFYEYAEAGITHPALREQLSQLVATWEASRK